MTDRERPQRAQTGFELLVTDPDAYFDAIWKRAEEAVGRQNERQADENVRRRAGFRRPDEQD